MSDSPNTNAANSNYGEDQIKVLEGLEAVRLRPGMYIGGTDLRALHHLVYEVVDNSIDEAMAGFADTVAVTIHADGSCSVVDNGRGIPLGPKKHENPAYDGKPAVEIVLTVLHAGGKFGEEGSAYKVSGGLHGVGVSCVNALSEWLECEVYREGKVHKIAFERGRTSEKLHVVGGMDAGGGAGLKTGTKVVFMPDPEIFPDTTFDYTTLQTRLRELSYLNPGVTIRLRDERVGPDGRMRQDTFKSKDGLLEYVEHLMTGKTAVSAPVHVKKTDSENGLFCEVAMQYHDGYNETLLSFANNINNVDGGTHAGGFKVALTRTLNAYAKRAEILREKDPVPTGEDLREGLVAIVSVKLQNPTFNNQPKEKLLNPEVEGFVSAAVGEALGAWLEEHPSEAKKLCLKGINAAQAREAARKARELTRRKSALESGSMPAKLKDCKTKDVDSSEIFLVEGDSAGGSAGQGRNVENQAILPLRGKLLNVEKARIDKVLGFEEIRTLISALKCNISTEFDISKLRYGRVVIMTDADVDGSHIRTLLLTFFFRQMPELIRRGKVFIAQPPLYQLAWGGGKNRRTQYVLNDAKLDDMLMEVGLQRASLVIRKTDAADASTVVFDEKTRQATTAKRVEGEELTRLIRVLRRLGELVEIAERRGVKFADLLGARDRDPSGRKKLPTHRVVWMGGEAWAWSEADARKVAHEHRLVLAEMDEGGSLVSAAGGEGIATETGAALPAHSTSLGQMRELHENRELERLFELLGRLGLDINDYTLVQEESVTGDKLPTKYAWELRKDVAVEEVVTSAPSTAAPATEEDGTEAAGSESRHAGESRASRVVEVANLPGILSGLYDVGKRGLEVKRFKGLGEMDAEQLWETTMDPTRRTLLRVTWDGAAEADTLFTILMGEGVEARRKFIEEHALEVKNLDV
ncbi:MAG: DNA gyrase subunit B [Phycisphaerales bacterium]|nr:DNA gyrase subunit B [Phycisphaerales bacterium]